jgi:DNA polymerase delta subunit 1
MQLVKKRSLWGYKGDDMILFLKIVINEPKALPRVRGECACIRM